MANANKVVLVGRLTRDPEIHVFANGGKVAQFGICVNHKKKNQGSGAWEDEPTFIDCKAFNRGQNGRTADLIAEFLKKGSPVYLEGAIRMDNWEDRNTGQKRSKLYVLVDNFQFLDSRNGNGGNGGGRAERPAEDRDEPSGGGKPAADDEGGSYGGEDIPF